MSYIGKSPSIGNFQKCDSISVVNGQATYALTVGGSAVFPESSNHVLCSLNGILQAPQDSFTISSSNIVFASNLATGDVIDFVMILGNVLDLGVPSDNTVSASKLTNDIISGQTELATTPADTDEFLVSDAGTIKRIDYSLIKGGASNAFHAYDMSSNTSGDLVFSTELYDDGGNYNTSNGRYTAPSDGTYLFNSGAMSTGTAAKIIFKKNGSDFAGGGDMFGYSPDSSTQGVAHLIVDLSASDYINVNANNAVYGNYIFFNGVKLY